MFENIIGHSTVIEQIRKEIESNTFPSSVLISGPLYSGKQTIALEAARAITCTEGGSWNCKCESCRLHRVLSNPSTLLLGSDFFMQEITAVKELLERKKETFSIYLFIRGVRKLLRRFDPVLVEENDTKYRKVSSLVKSVEELLSDFDPEYSLPGGEIDYQKAETIAGNCRTIIKDYNFGYITVDQIRKAGYWVRFSGYGSRKVIIIENADNMNDSSRNALLKILEEPPANVFIILLTRRPGEIIPTIKSRLRKYELVERSSSENKAVIEKIFREESGIYTSIRSYLDSSTPESEMVKKGAHQFVIDLFDNNREGWGLAPEVKAVLKTQYAEFFPDFLDELLNLSGKLLKSDEFIDRSPENLAFIGKFANLVNESYKRYETLNINQELLAESMFLELKNSL